MAPLSAEDFRGLIVRNIRTHSGRTPEFASKYDWYNAVALAVREQIYATENVAMARFKKKDTRLVAYLSAEFLLGPHLRNHIINLGIRNPVEEALKSLDQDFDDIMAQETEPGLGNGGLGRLAACFLDSLATLGVPAAGYGIRILDENRDPVKPGETGHLECRGIRGLSLFAEYMGMADKTAESFTPDGWFITGDRVTLGADGVITFADRDKDMLKVGGENVAASEIERVIAPVAGVREVAIVTQKHPMLDEVPVAFVIPVDGFPADAHRDLEARILAACKANLADFKQPRAVHIVAEMPRSTLEKVNKAELRKLLE